MTAALLYLALFLVILVLLYALAFYVKTEVGRQIDLRESHELKRIQAMHAIKHEMKASSHRLLAAAIDPDSEQFKVVVDDDLDGSGR